MAEDKTLQFHEMGLDDRILEAVARLGWKEPTLIQEKAIPYMLEGKDILARARTGSGKTGAFAIPVIHKVLESKRIATEQAVRVLMLAPSKELCRQITTNVHQLTAACRREVRCIDVSAQVSLEEQRPLLADKPDIVVGTPMRVLAHLEAKNLDLKNLEMLVIDEADLMFAFDHEKDITAVLKHLPSIHQSFVTSATMGDDVKSLKKLVLHNPVVLRLEEPPLPTTAQLTQYVIKVEDFEKFVLMYALFKLNMIRGKTILFVNTVDRAYKLRMFLGQFDISSCVLNSEMPVGSRCHIVEEFNKGKYDVVIASDERTLEDPGTAKSNDKKSKRKKDKESGVSRGIDFQFVSNVVNFDFPPDVDSYIHRTGRTARGNNTGTALSLVSVKDMETFEKVEEKLKTLMGTTSDMTVFKNFNFDLAQLDGFRYRAKDAFQRCTSIAIKETRKKEIRQEILNSAKLRSFFQDNPRDLQLLRHDKSAHALTPMPHLKHIPDYIVPDTLRKVSSKGRKKRKINRNAPTRSLKGRRQMSSAKGRLLKRKEDPLKSMEFKGFKKLKS